MKLNEVAKKLHLENLTPELEAESTADITRGHASDLLSDVLANAPAGGVLVTIQVHMNIVAVALHAGLAGVILASGRRPEDTVIKKAAEERIPLFVAEQSTFEVVGRLHEMGVRGGAES